MPVFSYTIKKSPTDIVSGEVTASHQQEAVRMLTSSGGFLVKLVEKNQISKKSVRGIFTGVAISSKHIAGFTAQLASLLAAHISVPESLEVIARQPRFSAMRKIVTAMIDDVHRGLSLSESLSVHAVFSKVYLSVVRSGEVSGTLADVLKNLAEFLESQESFKRSFTQACMYPLFLLGVSSVTVAGLLIFVVPRMAQLFTDLGGAMPLPTRIVLSVAGFMGSFWWVIVAGIVCGVYAWKGLSRNEYIRYAISRVQIRIKPLAVFSSAIEVNRFLRTLATLLRNGVNMSQALQVSRDVVSNEIIKRELNGVISDVSNGVSLSESLSHSSVFSEYIISFMRAGEQTGTLDEMIARVCVELEKETEQMLVVFSRLIEPAIIVVIGSVIGGIVVAMVLPIFRIATLIQ